MHVPAEQLNDAIVRLIWLLPPPKKKLFGNSILQVKFILSQRQTTKAQARLHKGQIGWLVSHTTSLLMINIGRSRGLGPGPKRKPACFSQILAVDGVAFVRVPIYSFILSSIRRGRTCRFWRSRASSRRSSYRWGTLDTRPAARCYLRGALVVAFSRRLGSGNQTYSAKPHRSASQRKKARVGTPYEVNARSERRMGGSLRAYSRERGCPAKTTSPRLCHLANTIVVVVESCSNIPTILEGCAPRISEP